MTTSTRACLSRESGELSSSMWMCTIVIQASRCRGNCVHCQIHQPTAHLMWFLYRVLLPSSAQNTVCRATS